jgi:hypothetical protein
LRLLRTQLIQLCPQPGDALPRGRRPGLLLGILLLDARGWGGPPVAAENQKVGDGQRPGPEASA